jgi:hypothetical protein
MNQGLWARRSLTVEIKSGDFEAIGTSRDNSMGRTCDICL